MIEIPNLSDGFMFHHLGYATESIERERVLFEFLGYQLEGKPFIDVRQGISGSFLCGPGPRIELLENLPDSETLTPWIKAKIKIYHLGFIVNNIDDAIKSMRSQRSKVVVPPVPATAFRGRRISFIMFRNGQILELIEKAHQLSS